MRRRFSGIYVIKSNNPIENTHSCSARGSSSRFKPIPPLWPQTPPILPLLGTSSIIPLLLLVFSIDIKHAQSLPCYRIKPPPILHPLIIAIGYHPNSPYSGTHRLRLIYSIHFLSFIYILNLAVASPIPLSPLQPK